MKIELIKTFQFEAAHRGPWNGDPNRLHGHSYEVDIVVEGPCDDRLGWLVDYGEISDRFNPLYKQLDHRVLNDVEGMQTATLPDLRRWLMLQLAGDLPQLKDIRVRIRGEGSFNPQTQPSSSESENRVRFGFEAAHALPNLPSSHKCYNMHGHSFLIDVSAKTDRALAPWLSQIYDRVDHRCLNDLPGLGNPTSEWISRWIWERLTNEIEGLTEVMVAETCTARCIYRGE